VKSIWHLVRKDLLRLRIAVILLSLLGVVKIAFYGAIVGQLRPPDLEWINRLQSGPELLLRTLTEPLITYLLVGWLIFEDSPLEQDAHWVTRPISGLQLFVAKAVGAVVMFVVLPLAINLAWWAFCGFDARDTAVATGELVTLRALLVSIGLLLASLTGAYPRFVLWSLAGLGAFAAMLIIVLYFGGPASGLFGLLISRLMAWSLGGSGVALFVSAHQFATRRYKRSLAVLAIGTAAVVALGASWHWDVTIAGGRVLAEGDGLAERLTLKLDPLARDEHENGGQFARMNLEMVGIPANRVVSQIRADGQWKVDGVNVWNSRTRTDASGLRLQGLRRLLGPSTALPSAGTAMLSMPMPLRVARAAARKPLAFHANVDLDLFEGKVVAEVPLQKSDGGFTRRTAGVWYVSVGATTWKQRTNGRVSPGGSPDRAVSLLFCEQSVSGLAPLTLVRPSISYYALVNRATGQSILSDQGHSGPVANATLNQDQVICWQLYFPIGAASIKLEEWALVVIRLDEGETVKRTLDIDSVQLAGNPNVGA
jgi:hypothetical protein